MSHTERMTRSLFVSRLSRRTTVEDLEPIFKEFGRLKDVSLKTFLLKQDQSVTSAGGIQVLSPKNLYYDERDCEEAYRRAATVFLHGRELTVEFARGSRKSWCFPLNIGCFEKSVFFYNSNISAPREMRGKDSNRYSPPRRSRYTPENSYRPRRYSRSPSRHRSRSRTDYRRYDYEEDRRRTSRYRSRSRTLSRTPPERRKRSGQVNGHPKSRSRSPRGVQAPVEEKETAT
ncbi:28845_t:CDS:2 [Racocetra persica]|uniref:28845_t:CDS:1 n=1 Tax=Racocetra persica TaxID=160502 RepID=A0ACA9LU49_9GLOM|nr:28845_t:CDS:2 [Racocetra persica]